MYIFTRQELLICTGSQMGNLSSRTKHWGPALMGCQQGHDNSVSGCPGSRRSRTAGDTRLDLAPMRTLTLPYRHISDLFLSIQGLVLCSLTSSQTELCRRDEDEDVIFMCHNQKNLWPKKLPQKWWRARWPQMHRLLLVNLQRWRLKL